MLKICLYLSKLKHIISFIFFNCVRGFPHSSVGKESTCNTGDPSSIPESGRSPGEGIGYPLQYSCASLVTQLVRILLQCERPGFDPWVGKIPWRRERLPTPVFWPREFHGLYSPWVKEGRKESDTIGWLSKTEKGRYYSYFITKNPMIIDK